VLLLSGCRADEARVLDGRTQSIGTALAEERGHLLPRLGGRLRDVQRQFRCPADDN
jgi:hypothetical protein